MKHWQQENKRTNQRTVTSVTVQLSTSFFLFLSVSLAFSFLVTLAGSILAIVADQCVPVVPFLAPLTQLYLYSFFLSFVCILFLSF